MDYNAPFRSLIFDSWYDKYIGAIVLVLVKEGSVTRGQKISSFLNKKEYEVHEVGIMHPNMLPVEVSCIYVYMLLYTNCMHKLNCFSVTICRSNWLYCNKNDFSEGSRCW